MTLQSICCEVSTSRTQCSEAVEILKELPGKVDKQLARLKAARAKKTQVPVSSKDSADLNFQNNNSLFVPKRSLLPIPIYSAKV